MYSTLLILHVLAATVWTGGHLVLASVVLPRALREHSASVLLRFESGYERLGMPALIIQVVTGLMLAHRLLPSVGTWFDTGNPVARLVMLKLGFLLLTTLFALDARLRLIPNLTDDKLRAMAFHIVPVTVLSVLLVIVGVSFRTGSLY